MSESIQLIDDINTSIEKAKAIADLMAASVLDRSIDHDKELRWAEMVIRDLLDSAKEQANALFEVAKAKE